MSDFMYRHYIYVDSDEVLTTAAIMDHGITTDEFHRTTKEFGGGLGAKFLWALVPVDLSVRGGWRHEKEWKIRQSAYTTTEKVLDKIAPRATEITELSHGQVIRCDIELPSSTSYYANDGELGYDWPVVKQIARSWWQGLLTQDPGKKAAKRLDKLDRRRLVSCSVLDSSGISAPKTALLTLKPRYILDLADFSRRATIVGQVVDIRRDGEQLSVIKGGDRTWYEWSRVIDSSGSEGSTHGESRPEESTSPNVVAVRDTAPAGEMDQSKKSTTKKPGKIRRFLHLGREKGNPDSKALDAKLHEVTPADEKETTIVLRPIVIFK
jgi:hypothetical protein